MVVVQADVVGGSGGGSGFVAFMRKYYPCLQERQSLQLALSRLECARCVGVGGREKEEEKEFT